MKMEKMEKSLGLIRRGGRLFQEAGVEIWAEEGV
jgi:hypothetical protein